MMNVQSNFSILCQGAFRLRSQQSSMQSSANSCVTLDKLTSLSLSFPIHKMRLLLTSNSQDGMILRIKEVGKIVAKTATCLPNYLFPLSL